MRFDLFDSSSSIRCQWLGFLSSRKSTRSTNSQRSGSKKSSDPSKLFPSPCRKARRADSSSLFSFSTNSDDPETKSAIIHDSEYYHNDSDTQGQKFCVLRVKNKLFKVHKSVLERDNSAFSKMFRFHPSQADDTDDTNPICLSDSVDQFRDLLRVLYSFPKELPKLDIDGSNRNKLPRLLNVGELALKYRFTTLETWAVEHLRLIISDDSFCLTDDGARKELDIDDTMARVLEFSVAGDHHSLLDAVVKKLMTQVLWHDFFPGLRLLEVSERHSLQSTSLHRLLGVLYYRMLVTLETTEPTSTHTQPIFPPLMNLEKRMRFLSAYQSLTAVWNRLCSSPPPLPVSEPQDDDITLSDFPTHLNTLPDPHTSCTKAWTQHWFAAAQQVNASHHRCHESSRAGLNHSHSSPAAVLANLKQMMLILRKGTADSRTMCPQCSMDGLEAIALIRDEVIESLGDMFVYCT